MNLLGIKRLFVMTVNTPSFYDRSLLWGTISLSIIGLIMVTSASIGFSESNLFIYAQKTAIQLLLAMLIAFILLNVSIESWMRYNFILLFIAIFMLIAVLVMNVSINGAARWIPLGVFNFQPAELTKLAFFCYLASYLSRKATEVQQSFWGFCKPMAVMLVLSFLLLKQPDLGTVIVLFVVTLSILFVAGARLWQFLAIITSGIVAFTLLIIFEPYRLKRITVFLNPWEEQYNAGYQLVNSLIAIGNGGIFGQGLGNSIRKLGYLPESHTDFIFAIIAEELGFIGCILVLSILFFIAVKALLISRKAMKQGNSFSGYFAFEIGIWFGFQSLVNVGVTSGLLPTKGLTLPFISYGGSSLIVMFAAIAVLLRIDYENRQQPIKKVIIKTKK